jgi:hypothetical protein
LLLQLAIGSFDSERRHFSEKDTMLEAMIAGNSESKNQIGMKHV